MTILSNDLKTVRKNSVVASFRLYYPRSFSLSLRETGNISCTMFINYKLIDY
jgi:hypothetical protein